MSGRFHNQESFRASASFDVDVSAQFGVEIFGGNDRRPHRPQFPQPCERPTQPCLPQVEICRPQPPCPPRRPEVCPPPQPSYRTPGCFPTPGYNNGYPSYPGFNNNPYDRPPIASTGQAQWGTDNGWTANGGGIGWTTDVYGRSQGAGNMGWRNADGSMGQAQIRSGNGAGVIEWQTNTGQRGAYQWGPGYYSTVTVQQNPYVYRPQY